MSSIQQEAHLAQSDTPQTTWFDPHGDVKLLPNSPDGIQVFVVSSKTMTLLSDPWRAMLDPRGMFSEAQSQGSREISLPDDDPQPLSLLLHIAHLQFDKVPLQLEFEDLLAVAILTDKYQATQLVRPWLSRWIKHLEHLVDEPGYEEWLRIAWDFGIGSFFQRVASRMVLESSINEDKECLYSTEKVLGENMPSDIIESILDVREATIHRLLVTSYGYAERFLSEIDGEPLCRNRYDRRECDALAFGSLVLGLRRLELWPQKEGSQILRSVKELASGLLKMPTFTYPRYDRDRNDPEPCRNDHEPYRNDRDHDSCQYRQEWQDSIQRILREIPSVLKASHRRHLEMQRSKCLLEDYPDVQSLGD